MTGCAYALGLTALLGDDVDGAIGALRAAVAADPACVRSHAALAVALRVVGDHDGAAGSLSCARDSGRIPRRDRHHVAVIELTMAGDLDRASALGQEHLAEFPDDALVRLVLARWGPVS